jgi:glycine oxidase
MRLSREVLIVGGGVIGLTAAYYLRSRYQRQVTVLDRGEFGREASWAGAGMVPPARRATATTPWTQLLGLSYELLVSLSHELYERTGIDNEFRRCGGIEFVSGIDKTTVELWKAEGIPFQRLSGWELQRLEPELAAGLEDGYWLPNMGQVRNPRHLRALIAACQQMGVEFVDHAAVRQWRTQGDQIVAAETETATWQAERFLITAGAWTDEVARPLGYSFSIKPIRGQIVLLNPGRPLLHHIISSGLDYLVPRLDGRILVGSTEEDVGFAKGNTVEAVQRLTELACRIAPALANVPVESTWSGLRPFASRNRPILGPLPKHTNLYIAAGHFRSGLMLSAGTGWVIAQSLADQPTDISLDWFRAREIDLT